MPVAGHPPHTTTACGSTLGGSTKMSKFVGPSEPAFTMCQYL